MWLGRAGGRAGSLRVGLEPAWCAVRETEFLGGAWAWTPEGIRKPPPPSLQKFLLEASVWLRAWAPGGKRLREEEEEEVASQAPLCFKGEAGVTLSPGARFGFKSRLCHLLTVSRGAGWLIPLNFGFFICRKKGKMEGWAGQRDASLQKPDLCWIRKL